MTQERADRAGQVSRNLVPLFIAVLAFALFTSGIWSARRDALTDGSLLYLARFVQLVVCFVIAYLFRNHLPPVTGLVRFTGAVFASHITLYLINYASASQYPALSLTSTLFDGIGNAGVTLLLAHVFSTYAPRYSARAIAAAFLLTEILFACAALLPTAIIHTAQPILKVVGFCLLLIALREKGKAIPSVEEHPMQYGMLPDALVPDKPMQFLINSTDWTFQFIIATVFPFLFGFMSQLLSTNGLSAGLHDPNNEVVAISALILLLLYALPRGANFGLRGMLFVVVALYATGFLLFPLLYQQQSLYSGTLIKTAFTIYQVLLWILLARKSFEDPRHTYLYFGVFIGWANVSYGRLAAPLLLSDASFGLFGITYVSIASLWVLTVLCLVLFTLQRTMAGRGDSVLHDVGVRTQGDVPRDAFVRNLEAFSEAKKLTKREREVLVEAVHGYSMENIGKNLFCSPETVRTHMKNIYMKAGVSNKQALIKQIDEFQLAS